MTFLFAFDATALLAFAGAFLTCAGAFLTCPGQQSAAKGGHGSTALHMSVYSGKELMYCAQDQPIALYVQCCLAMVLQLMLSQGGQLAQQNLRVQSPMAQCC